MPLHDTRGALALAHPGDINDLAWSENVGIELLAEGVLARVVGADLDQVLARRHSSLIEVAGAGFGQLFGLDGAEAKLDSCVTVDVRSTDLGDHARACLDHSHRNNAVIAVPQLGHAE